VSLFETRRIEAQHPGVCADCERTFPVGTPIRNDGDGWVHVECPPGPAPRPVCPGCFMETALNGACSCAS
jgi:hypothetical protein